MISLEPPTLCSAHHGYPYFTDKAEESFTSAVAVAITVLLPKVTQMLGCAAGIQIHIL